MKVLYDAKSSSFKPAFDYHTSYFTMTMVVLNSPYSEQSYIGQSICQVFHTHFSNQEVVIQQNFENQCVTIFAPMLVRQHNGRVRPTQKHHPSQKWFIEFLHPHTIDSHNGIHIIVSMRCIRRVFRVTAPVEAEGSQNR